MSDERQAIPAVGVYATVAMAASMAIQLDGQTARVGDYTNAAVAEVQDAQGQIVLRGLFATVEEEDDDVERKARLEPTGTDTDAAGEAEVEFTKTRPVRQEIEYSVRNLQPGTTLTFLIDGQAITQATTDSRGRAEVEVDVPMP